MKKIIINDYIGIQDESIDHIHPRLLYPNITLEELNKIDDEVYSVSPIHIKWLETQYQKYKLKYRVLLRGEDVTDDMNRVYIEFAKSLKDLII